MLEAFIVDPPTDNTTSVPLESLLYKFPSVLAYKAREPTGGIEQLFDVKKLEAQINTGPVALKSPLIDKVLLGLEVLIPITPSSVGFKAFPTCNTSIPSLS
jgi:hypothetical protein